MSELKIPIRFKTYSYAKRYLPDVWFRVLFSVEVDYVDWCYLFNVTQFQKAGIVQMISKAIDEEYKSVNATPVFVMFGIVLSILLSCHVIFGLSIIYSGIVGIAMFSVLNYQSSENVQRYENIAHAQYILSELTQIITSGDVTSIQLGDTNGTSDCPNR